MSDRASKEKKLLKNTIWYSLGTFSSKAAVFFLVPLYTSVLTTEEFSISDIISTLVSLVTPFFTLIISSAVFRFVLEKKENAKGYFSFGLWIVVLGSLPLLVISYLAFLHIKIISDYWVYFCLIYITTSLSTLESEFLKGLERVKLVAITEFVKTLVFVFSNVIFLICLHYRIEGYLFSFVLSNFVAILIYFFYGKVYSYITSLQSVECETKKSMLRYSVPLIPNSAMWWITNCSDRYFVSALVSVSANGLLSISYKIPSIFGLFINVFHGAWELSVIDDFENEKGQAFFRDVYQKYIEFIVIISASLILFSKILGTFLYSGDFFLAWKFSALLIISSSFHSMAGFLGTVFTTVKKTNIIFVSTALGAVINLILNYFFISLWGILGAVFATIVSCFVVYVIRRIKAREYVKICGKLYLNIFSFTLLFFEMFFVYLDYSLGWISAAFIFVTLCIINRSFFITLLNVLNSKIRRNK